MFQNALSMVTVRSAYFNETNNMAAKVVGHTSYGRIMEVVWR